MKKVVDKNVRKTTNYFWENSPREKYFLKFKNLRQLNHKGRMPGTFKNGMKEIRFVEFANYPAQITLFRTKIRKASPLQNASQAKMRTVLDRFWTEKRIAGLNCSKTRPYTCKPHVVIRNDISNAHLRFLSIVHRLVSVYGTVRPSARHPSNVKEPAGQVAPHEQVTN